MPILKHDILNTEIWEASDEEIRSLWWDTPPEDHHRFWSNDEVTSCILCTPEQLADCLARKKAKPGRL